MQNNSNVIIKPLIRDQGLLAKYYSMADCTVLTSKRESFSMVVAESLCCGTPVAAFRSGGPETIAIPAWSRFVDYGDLDGLEQSLNEILGGSCPDFSEEARQRYSNETMIQSYLEQYDAGGPAERVLLIDINCRHSSTGKIVYDLYRALRDRGRRAAVCYGRGPKVEEPDILKFGLDPETVLHAALARVTGLNGCFSPLSTRRLIRFIEEFRPDVVHIHELHAYFVDLKPLLSYLSRKGIRVVWTFHCEYMYTGKCGHAFDCTGFQRECGHCPAVREYPKSLFLDRTKRMLRQKKALMAPLNLTIAVPSRWMARRVQESFLKDRPIRVIHNGVNAGIFHPVDAGDLRRELGIPEDHRVVLAAAPNLFSEAKGGRWVLQLAERFRDRKVTFVLVGDTEKGASK